MVPFVIEATLAASPLAYISQPLAFGSLGECKPATDHFENNIYLLLSTASDMVATAVTKLLFLYGNLAFRLLISQTGG
jgi:hypothetical protein